MAVGTPIKITQKIFLAGPDKNEKIIQGRVVEEGLRKGRGTVEEVLMNSWKKSMIFRKNLNQWLREFEASREATFNTHGSFELFFLEN